MKKKELCIVCLLFVFCRCGDDLGTLTFSGQGCIPDVADKYRYPANDPKKQISYAQSQEERCQVPASEVKKMSTFGLIRTLLDAPCLSATSLMLSSDLSSINRRNNLYWYNAAKELVERKEAAHALLTFYNAIHFDCVGKIDFEQLTDYEQKIVLVKQEMDFFVHLATLELLFSEEKLLKRLDANNLRQLANILLEKHKAKQQIKTDFHPYTYSLFAMLHTMLHAGYQPATDYVNQWGESSREKDSLLDGYYTPEQAGDIVALAENYIR